MKLSLLANVALKPLIEALRPHLLHDFELNILSDHPTTARAQIKAATSAAYDMDALILLDGYDLLPENVWENGEIPFVVPKVHNVAGLILGDEDIFRCLYHLYDGNLSWFLPGGLREYSCVPLEDVQALCRLVVTQIPLADEGLTARAVAQYHNWDFFEQPCDLSLLESLLGGQWADDAFVFAPGAEILVPSDC